MEYLGISQSDYDNIQDFDSLENHLKIGKKLKKLAKGAGKVAKKVGKKAFKVSGAGLAVKGVKTVKKKKLIGKGLKAVGKAGKKVGKGIGKAAKAVGKVVKAVGQEALVAPLIPLRGVMLKSLDSHGHKTSSKTSTMKLANLFYNEVVRKKDSSYEAIDINNLEDEHIAPAVLAIVTGIIDYIKSLKKKKASGEPLTKAEQEIMKQTENVESKIASGQSVIDDVVAKQEAQAIGETVMDVKKDLFEPKTLLIIAVIGIGIFLLVKK